MSDEPLQPGRINSYIYRLIQNTLFELELNIGRGLRTEYPTLQSLIEHIELHAPAFSFYKDYLLNKNYINNTYGRGNKMSPEEAMDRLRLILLLANKIGIFQLRERYAKPKARPAENVETISLDFPLTYEHDEVYDQLFNFYLDELSQEYEDKKFVHLKEREANKRAGRAFEFYMRYKEYEESGFNPSLIESLFGIDKQKQKQILFWMNELVPRGLATSAFAHQGMGKSNTGTFITQMILLLKPEWDIVTNIPFTFSPKVKLIREYEIKRIQIVESMSDLLMKSSEIVLNDRIPAVVIDEFDSSYTSTQTRSKVGVDFKTYIYVERHLDTRGPLLIYHRYKDIPTELRNKDVSRDVFQVANYRNYVENITRRVISNPDFWNYGQQGLRCFPIPLCSLPYLNQGFGSFTMDMPMQDLNQHLNGTKKQASQQIIDYIEEMRVKEEAKEENPVI